MRLHSSFSELLHQWERDLWQVQEVMEEPVAAADGHFYNRAHIQQWFDTGSRTSPITGAQLPNTGLRPVYPLKSAIKEWQQKRHPAA